MKYLGILFTAFCLVLGIGATDPARIDETPWENMLEMPPRIGLYTRNAPDGTFGFSLTGVAETEYFSGVQFAFFGEELEKKSNSGLWFGWYGEMKNQWGLQFAFVNRVWNQSAAQFAAGANYSGENNGMQAAGLINQALELNGFQLSAMGNLADEANGLQLSVLLNQAERGSGVQLALFNVSGVPLELPLKEPTEQQKGFVVQIGLENYSVDRKVFQLGIYNDKSEPGFQLGLINYSRTGFFKWMPFFNW